MRLLALLFFFSGATSLVWESLWSRDLHLIFGTSQFAITTVLAAFMAGMGVGGAWVARRGAVARPLAAYGWLEAVIGIFGIAFPWLKHAIEPIYLLFHHTFSPSPLVFGAFQFALLGVALLLPTACMGATLPVLAAGVRSYRPGTAIGRLYAINTAGAVFGTWLGGFVLLPTLGVSVTAWSTGVLNLTITALALWLQRKADTSPALLHDTPEASEEERLAAEGLAPVPVPASSAAASSPATEAPPEWAMPFPRLLAIAALAGASSLILEVAWFRLLSLISGASVYAFSVMLLSFLVGIAGGGHLGGPLADRLGVGRAWRGLLACQLAIVILAAGAMHLWAELPYWFVQLFFATSAMPSLLWPVQAILAMTLMVPPALAMGATFPLLVRAAGTDDLTRPVGALYAANTFGGMLGSFLAGFVFLPQLWMQNTVLLATCVNLVAAAVALAPRWRWPGSGALLVVGALAFVVKPTWDGMWMTAGLYKYVDNLDTPSWAEIQEEMLGRHELLYYNEGLSTVVTVASTKKTGNRWLANNGKIDASSTADMPTQVLVAHLPFLYTPLPGQPHPHHPPPTRTALIGLASGITLGALTLHPEIQQIDVVELEPSMPEAAAFFTQWNRDALHDPRVRLIANDGRNHLLLTPPGTYDVVIAEPSNPWLTGVANLFTREFFEMGKARLTPGGLWSQWVQMYGMDNRDLRAIVKTFFTVFPHGVVFSTIDDADLVMIGSDAPLSLTPEGLSHLLRKAPALTEELGSIGIKTDADLARIFLFDRDTALTYAGDAPLNTDDNLLVEYSAPKNLHIHTSADNFLSLLKHPQIPASALPDADALLALGDRYAQEEDYVRALLTAREAERREPGRPDVLERYTRWQALLLGTAAP